MDQHRVAGVGNLLADEILWRAGMDPRAAPRSAATRCGRCTPSLRSTLRQLDRRGGSHMGDVMEERHAGGRCPRDGTELRHDIVGGRSTWWCPEHQR